GYFVRKNISEAKIGQAETMADDIIDKAKKDAETLQKEKLLEAKEEIHKWRNEAEKEYNKTYNINKKSTYIIKVLFCFDGYKIKFLKVSFSNYLFL
ncbi:Rnase Y domain-containing protein, partial [Paeniclostridium sordellii]|uniref:Rnase Y domain-containing protein n=1 Tax=Paraclostridium sordellii TaxID=1505 RepID=UPI00210EA7BF